MRRLTVETNWEGVWRRVFRPHSDKVQILEVMRCFKCDADGFAIICKIELKDETMSVEDLAGNDVLVNVETLYEEKDGSFVVFIEGKLPVPAGERRFSELKIVLAGPPEFLDVNRQKATVVGTATELSKVLQLSKEYAEEVPHKILAVTSLKPESESLLSRLTRKQRQALILAYALGYYDLPRKISSEGLARRLKVDKTTLVEHLRKAQRKVLGGVISG